MKILVVDDNEDARVLLKTILESQGHTVGTANNGTRALQSVRRMKPELIISDIMMPGMDGFELCRTIKEDEQLKNIPVILFTVTFTGPSDQDLAAAVGASRFIIKPVETQGLIKVINDVLKDYKKLRSEVPLVLGTSKDELDRLHYRSVVNKLEEKVHELDKTNRTLQQSEARYRGLVEQAFDTLLLFNKEGRFIDVNQHACDSLRYTREELLRLSIQDIDIDTASGGAAKFMKEMVPGRPLTITETYKRKDGTTFPVEVRTGVIKSNGYQLVLALARDITERKKAEETLDWELSINKALAELSNALIASLSSIEEISGIVLEHAKLITKSEHGYVSEIDQLTGNMIAHTLTSMMGKQCLVTGKDKRIVFPRGADGRYPTLWGHSLNKRESLYTNSPGTHKWSTGIPKGHVPLINFLCVPAIFGEDLLGQIALANSERDYTEHDVKVIERLAGLYAIAIHRMRMEDELRDSEANLAEAQRIAKVGNYILDIKKDKFIWSRGTYLIFGAGPEEIEPNFQGFTSLILPGDRKRVSNIINGAIRDKSKYSMEYHIRWKNGSERILSDEGEVGCDELGDPVQVFGVVRDITDQRILQKSLLEIEERERRRIGFDLHDGLGQLLTGIAFKSRSLESILKEKMLPEAEEAAKIRSLIDQSKEQVKLLAKWISPVEMDKEGLMAALTFLVSNTEKLFNISCSFRFDKPVPIYNEAAVTHLYRIAQEAVTNAVKHGKPEHIEIDLSRKHDKVKLTIKDNGKGTPGISRLTTGMGLRIMNYRANMIGASLDIESNADKGTMVTCVFPDRPARTGAKGLKNEKRQKQKK